MAKQILKAHQVRGEYKPTPEEKLNLVAKENEFVLSGDSVFHTIQGEGSFIGKPTTFIRLHLCNLCCKFCDTFYTWNAKTKEFRSEPKKVSILDMYTKIQTAQKQKKVKEFCNSICFTGGEPLLQQDKIIRFMKAYPELQVQIETNGTIEPDDFLIEHAHFNCSPKLKNSGNIGLVTHNKKVIDKIIQGKKYCFKFVCKSIEDIQEVETTYNYIPKENVYIMPEGILVEENMRVYKRIINKIIEKGYATTPRIQNICFDGATRGV